MPRTKGFSWGLAVSLCQDGGQLARAAQVFLDLSDDLDDAGSVDRDEYDEAAEILERAINHWWGEAEKFKASSQRQMDAAVADRYARRIRAALSGVSTHRDGSIHLSGLQLERASVSRQKGDSEANDRRSP